MVTVVALLLTRAKRQQQLLPRRKTPMRTLPNLITLAACLSLLSACGGGGGGGSSSAPTSPPAVTNQAPSLVVDAEVAVVEGSLEIVTATATARRNLE